MICNTILIVQQQQKCLYMTLKIKFKENGELGVNMQKKEK